MCTVVVNLYITAIASATGHTSGKWLIYRKPSLVDEVWEAVARCVVEGKLGTAAKASIISPT